MDKSARYNVDQGLRDPWLMDMQCLDDISGLEEKARELGDFVFFFCSVAFS